MGRNKLRLKKIILTKTVIPVVIYTLLSSIYKPTLVAEIMPILTKAHNKLDKELINYEHRREVMPITGTRLKMLKIKG